MLKQQQRDILLFHISWIIMLNGSVKSFKNIFIEDYYFKKQRSTSDTTAWGVYIGNFYNSKYGESLTCAQIKEKLGEGIIYGAMPNNVVIKDEDRWRLEEITLEETNKTEKGTA